VNVATGVGFTVIVNVSGVPVQPDNVGVTVIEATTGLEVVFVAVNAGRLVVPLAASPIDGAEFVQVYVAPTGVLVNVFAPTGAPLQTVMFASELIAGGALTVMKFIIVTGALLPPPLVAVRLTE
jgi:hypothetical protein